MGLFNWMKKNSEPVAPAAEESVALEKKKEEPEYTDAQLAYIAKYDEIEDSPGWDAIDRALDAIYPRGSERHYGTVVKYFMGGKDPLDGLSIYDSEEQQFHRHVVSYGMSELYYSPKSVGRDFSRWGCEFTIRVVPYEEDANVEKRDGTIAEHEPNWAMNLMQNLARYVYETGKYFEAYHFIPTNSPIRAGTDTKLVGIIFAPDPQLGSIDTEHGKVEFLQMFGITQKELGWLFEQPTTARGRELVEIIRNDNPMLITDLKRTKEYV